MEYICFVIIFGCILASIPGKTCVNGGPKLSGHQIDRICSRVNKMSLIGEPEAEIIKFIGEDIERMAQKHLRKDSNGQVEGYKSIDHGGDGQKVDIKSDSMVGKSGQLFEIKMIGTDSSTNTFNNLVRFQQSDDDVNQADYSDSIVNVNLQASTKLGLFGDNLNSHRITNGRKIWSTFDKCIKMIETAYQNHELSKFMENLPSRGFQKLSELIGQRSGYDVVNNSTSIDLQLSIGPNGFGSYISHIGREEATNSASGSEIDNQVHGNYEKSKVFLSDVTLSPILNT